MLSVAGPFLEQQMHPTVIIGAFRQALDDLLTILKDHVSVPVDITDRAEMMRIIKSCIGTKFITKWSVTVVLLQVYFYHKCKLYAINILVRSSMLLALFGGSYGLYYCHRSPSTR